MSRNEFEASNPGGSTVLGVGSLVGRWSVFEVHKVVYRQPGVRMCGIWLDTVTAELATGVGKSSVEWMFDQQGVTYNILTEGKFALPPVQSASDLYSALYQLTRETNQEAERPFQSQALALLQGSTSDVLGTFHSPYCAPLLMHGCLYHECVTFRAEDGWACSALLVELIDVIRRVRGCSPKALIVFRLLKANLWMLCVYHVFTEDDEVLVVRSSFFHERLVEQTQAPEEYSSVESIRSVRPRASTQQIINLEDELERAEQELTEARDRRERIQGEVEECEGEVDDFELELLSASGLLTRPDDPEATGNEMEAKICSSYRKWLDLAEELANHNDEIDTLENEVRELEDLIEEGITEWQEAKIAEGERLIAEASKAGTLPEVDLGEFEFVDGYPVSEEVRKMLLTCQTLHDLFQTRHIEQREPLDNSPVIAQMSKICERLFCDACSERWSSVLANPSVEHLLGNWKRCNFDIPEEDKAHIKRESLEKVLSMIRKNELARWSGTRNCAMALLLFGRRYRITNGSPFDVDNPLGIPGTDFELTQLRVALYRLQEVRNGFIHHDVANWDHVELVEGIFRDCVRGLVTLLYRRL